MVIGPVNSSGNVQKTDGNKELSKSQDMRVKKACQQFEGIFIATMLKESLETSKAEGDSGKKDKDTYETLEKVAIEKAGEDLATSEGGGFGLWRVLYESLTGKDSEELEHHSVEASGKGDDGEKAVE